MKRIIKATEKIPNRENVVEVWKGRTTEDAIVIMEKAVKTTKPETIHSCPVIVYDCTGFMTQPIREIIKEIVDMTERGAGWWWKGFKIQILEKVKN